MVFLDFFPVIRSGYQQQEDNCSAYKRHYRIKRMNASVKKCSHTYTPLLYHFKTQADLLKPFDFKAFSSSLFIFS